jgi:hypothetical protein
VTLTATGCMLSANQAVGGAGGTGVHGGNGQGGGLFNFVGTVSIAQCIITDNLAEGGAGGAGGMAGTAHGGGVYNDKVDGGTISIDALTVIFGNTPDDCFGC